MIGEQLDLLSWSPPCRVHAFPLARRITKIKAVAENLHRKHGKAADSYWRQTVSTLAGQLSRAGVPDSEISEAVRGFFDAVQMEMTIQDYRKLGGGA
jgi:hypothetical protein